MIIVGIDPGSGVSSPTGLVIYDDESELISWFGTVTSKAKKVENRIQHISKEVEKVVKLAIGLDPEPLVCIENFVMRGKGGETLQMLIGAIISRMPEEATIMQPYNTSVKKVVGGHGRAEKPEVAAGVLEVFKGSESAVFTIKDLIAKEQWDILDALAIGITGSRQYDDGKKPKQPASKRNSKKRS
jgi:Holliday junction resolvasome RuvABC endonuclease subunit